MVIYIFLMYEILLLVICDIQLIELENWTFISFHMPYSSFFRYW